MLQNRGVKPIGTEKLKVYKSNKVKSPVVYELEFGQIVKVLHKSRKWTLIEYENDEDEVIIQGWVFSRYVKKFKR
ncbi:MAG: SH3 domain-containing protein [Bacteroidales bacterium]|nr:SH3 domain-containing protein [Bacteroidales bacterium]